MKDSFDTLRTEDGATFVDLAAAAEALPGLERLPVSLRLVVENLLRNEDGVSVGADDIRRVVEAGLAGQGGEIEIAFRPTRVVMQDYAGMPALIDLAALRDRAEAAGVDPAAIGPRIPADLVVDHSVMVHAARVPDALARNLKREYADNAERFAFLKWAQTAFEGLRVVPPGQGIIHQINIEFLSEVVSRRRVDGREWMFPDTVIGTDSHTTMVNGLGVLGWGVGGIEAEAVMLGEPVTMLLPPVVGVRLTGALPAGTLATDLVLTLTERLRQKGVVGAILEFYGPGVGALSVADRVTIANMSPEFGSTAAMFPTDARTLDYLLLTGRSEAQVALVERHLRRTNLWFDPEAVPVFADTVELDLSEVRQSMAGPRRPEERLDPAAVPAATRAMAGEGAAEEASARLSDGDIVIAAITSCTNTSNPEAMLAAGLLARNAEARGLTVHTRIKTSLAPGSRVVVDYLEAAGLMQPLAALGFDLVAFGCTTCVGNSGELDPAISEEIDRRGLTVSAVLSGNRNFEGRIHARVKANFLASPPLVVAWALAGTTLIDVTRDPIGTDAEGRPVRLAEIWPDGDEVQALMAETVTRDRFRARYADVLSGGADWDALPAGQGATFAWVEGSTYFRRPPFFDLPPLFAEGRPLIAAARPLLILGDSVTTDHISPVGGIPPGSPAAEYLEAAGVARADWNAYGARRGNHEVMVRGTFANPRLRNELADAPGGVTRLQPEDTRATVHEAAEAYAARGEPAVVLAGRMYGAGSARDWAAKGTRLLGVAAVIAESFERIHRSNLVRMGVLPLEFADGATREWIGAGDRLSVDAPLEALAPLARLELRVVSPDGAERVLPVRARVDTRDELRYLRHGGILPAVAETILGQAEPVA